MRVSGVGAGSFANNFMAAFGLVDNAFARRDAEARAKAEFAHKELEWKRDEDAQKVVKNALDYDPTAQQAAPTAVPIAAGGINQDAQGAVPDELIGSQPQATAPTPAPAPLTPTQAIEKKAEKLRLARAQLSALGAPALQKYGAALDEQRKSLMAAHVQSFQPQEATSDGILSERDALRLAAHTVRGQVLFGDAPPPDQMLAISSMAKRLERSNILEGADAAHLGNLEEAKKAWSGIKELPGELVGLKPMVSDIGGIKVKTNAAVFKTKDGKIVEVPAIDMAKHGMALKDMVDMDLKAAETKSKIDYRAAMAGKAAAAGVNGGRPPSQVATAQWLVNNKVAKDATEAWNMVKTLGGKSREAAIQDIVTRLISGPSGIMYSGPNGKTKATQEAMQIYDAIHANEGEASPGDDYTGPRPWAAGVPK